MQDIVIIVLGCLLTAAYFAASGYFSYVWSNGDLRTSQRFMGLFVGAFVVFAVVIRYL